MNSKKILLVEDDPFLSQLLKSRLARSGFEVQSADTSDEVVSAVKKEKFALVLMDLMLPGGKSGFELLATLKAAPETAATPVIIISNLGQSDDVARGKELGAAEYYIKAQTSLDDLVEKIKVHIGGSH